MKLDFRKSLIAVIGAAAVLAFSLSAVVAQQKQTTKKTKPTAKAVTPQSQQSGAVANPAMLTAPLTAKVSPNLITVNKKTPVPYKPITLADLKDPKTGKTPTADTVLTLWNGQKVVAGTYVTKINAIREKFNALGYSLISGETKVTIQETNFNKPLLEKQAAKAKAFKAVDTKAQSMATSPKVLETEYNAAVKAYKAEAKTKAAEGSKGKTAASKESAAAASKKNVRGEVGNVLGKAYKPYSITKSFDDPWGDNSVFGAEISGSLTFKGNGNGASLAGQAKAAGSILGNTKDLADATANLDVPRTGKLTANIKITVLGVDVAVLNESQSVDFSKQDTVTKTLPDVFKVSYQFSIGPVPVKAVVGAKGSVSMQYYVALLPASSTAWMIPTVQASVYAQIAVDIEYDETGFEAGVEADLTLLNNKLTLAGGASEGTDSTGAFISYWLTSRDDLTVLAGKVMFYVKAEVYGYTLHQWDDPIYEYSGIQKVYTPVAGGDKVYLQQVKFAAPLPNATNTNQK